MEFTPTLEQLAIIHEAKASDRNLLITALAGAAKTSTLVLIANELKVNSLAISFNSRIAKEMKERLPGWVESRTLNSLGHKVWGDNKGRRPFVDTAKTFRLVKDFIESVTNGDDKSFLYERMGDLMRAVGGLKTAGYVPSSFKTATPLLSDDEAFAWLEDEPSDIEWALIQRVLTQSVNEALGNDGKITIDFDDQLLMPTVFPVSFPLMPLVYVDEAQDLSALNHAMLAKFAKRRLIAVGDENQAIYGFRGAHEDSMSLLQHKFDMKPLVLSVSFRCPVSVVEVARQRAPHMQYPEWAKPGKVTHLSDWGTADLPDDAVILCRNNAPLFGMAITLLKNKRYPQLVGSDIGKTLIKWMGTLGDDDLSQADALVALEAWAEAKKAKSRNPDKVDDQAACMAIFIEQGRTLGDAKAYAKAILEQSGPIKLMTIHKAKGLEWDNVFLLDADLIGHEGQEPNLRYVAVTRAKDTLTYIFTEGFKEVSNVPAVS